MQNKENDRMSEIASIRQTIDKDVFDHQAFLSTLRTYAKPRDKITRLLARREHRARKEGSLLFWRGFSQRSNLSRVSREPDLRTVLCKPQQGRDWHDLVWYIGRHPRVHLSHLESRMRQSGDYDGSAPMTAKLLQDLLQHAIEVLDVEQARREVAPFLKDPRALDIWSRDFFKQIVGRIVPTLS